MLHQASQWKARKGHHTSLLESYVDRYSDAVARRRANVAVRAARIEAELAYKTRGEILANMNHELRTPLNAIVGFANMLKEGETYNLSKEQTDEYLGFILQSAELLLTQINTILDLAAAESGGAKLYRQSVSARELFQSIVDKHKERAAKENIRLELAADTGLPQIDVDTSRIDTAVSHLIDNALTYCEAGCTVSVILLHGRRMGGKDWVYIAIRDDGEGMTSEELSRALRTFEQVSQGLHRKFEGAGIGLPLAKSFIELNGGRFHVKSIKDKGTTVRFALPAVVTAQAEAVGLDHDDREERLRVAG